MTLTDKEAAEFADPNSWLSRCLKVAQEDYALGSFLRSDPIALERYKLHIAIGYRQ